MYVQKLIGYRFAGGTTVLLNQLENQHLSRAKKNSVKWENIDKYVVIANRNKAIKRKTNISGF